MKVFVGTLIGKIYTFEIDEDCTIYKLKLLLCEQEGFYHKEVRFFMEDKSFEDDMTMKSCGISDGTKIFLLLKKIIPRK